MTPLTPASSTGSGSTAVLAVRPLGAAPSPDQAKLVAADTGFALGLLKELAREQPAQNVFISPYSISTALAMTAAGARGKTLDEMNKVLHLPDDPHAGFGDPVRGQPRRGVGPVPAR